MLHYAMVLYIGFIQQGLSMLTNNKFKTLILALAATTVMACSSGPSDEEILAETNRVAAAEQAEADKVRMESEVAAVARAEAARADEMVRLKAAAEDLKASLVNQNTVYFDFDVATIKADFISVLKKHADYLVANPSQTVVIEGHGDQRGTPEYNIALGERRGKSIETYFSNEGVSMSQITVVSYGEEKPAVMGASEYAMAQNRRGVVVYE
ncbi:MAG: peptidoglycan-associated lipoprotein [Kangiellaceae bacterium]|jgi:peptidoglycan-associated lipoprotein